MRYISNTTEFHMEGPSAVTLGKFDGLHRGHRKLMEEVLRLQKEGCSGVVFEIAPEERPSLYVPQEKREKLGEWGIDCMIHCPFVPEILSMEPETFISEVLHDKLHAKYIIVGTDFRFGHMRKGDVEFLKEMQEKYDYTLIVIPKECYEGREISSTYIRESLAGADMPLVRELMGSYYPVSGVVMHGQKLGHQIGMPTINIEPETYKLLPPPGVYYSDVLIKADAFLPDEAGMSRHGITNIGYKPTVDGNFLGVETYLYEVDDDPDLYGRTVTVSLREFRRQEIRFDSVDALKSQMERDILSGKEYFGVK